MKKTNCNCTCLFMRISSASETKVKLIEAVDESGCNSRLGVLLTDGDMWVEQRRFILRHLKNFGFARSGMMDIVHNEASCLLQDLRTRVTAAWYDPTTGVCVPSPPPP